MAKSNIRPITIEPFLPKDLKRLIHIFRLNVPEYFAPKEEKDFLTYLDSYSDNYFSITKNGIVIGGAGYKIDQENQVASISWIFIDPTYKGHGVGKYMVNYLLELFSKKENLRVLIVETSQHGYKFFGSFGFTTVKKEKDYWGRGLDLYKMEMVIQ